MTGRPSGRCAATEALEFYAALGPHDIPYADTINDPPDVGRVARAALASPCCVSADQEQVKEALEEARESLIEHACRLPLKRRDHGPALVKMDAALALLGSNEEEEDKHGR